MDEQTEATYRRAKIGRRLVLGVRPAVLTVDLINGFTDPQFLLGADLTGPVNTTRSVLDVARSAGFPVYFTTIQYDSGVTDCGLWLSKLPALCELKEGTRAVEIDSRLGRTPMETIIVKKGPSAFFGTNLASLLTAQQIDTVVLCGATTSGCIRATAIDLLQHSYPTVVPAECVGDRAQTPHEANLIDIDAKYADVSTVTDTVDYLTGIAAGQEAPAVR